MNGFLLDILQIVILIYSVVLHEVAHGLTARAMGDRTAEHMGRLTLNPLAHMELFGSFILPILTKIFGGFMFGYAKPVPYDPDNLSDRRWGPAKVGLAGPATNLALAALLGVIIRAAGPGLGDAATLLLSYGVLINIGLAFFNLMPVPPLDGHWLLMAVLPPSARELRIALYRGQWLLLAVVIFYVFPALFPLLEGLFTLLTGQVLF